MSKEAWVGTSRYWQLETIRDLLTAERLRSYLESCDQDLDRALALYEWNLTASSALLDGAHDRIHLGCHW